MGFKVDQYGAVYSTRDGRHWTRTETCNARSLSGTPCSLPLAHAPGHSWERRPEPFLTEAIEDGGSTWAAALILLGLLLLAVAAVLAVLA